jgi:kynureninase
MPNRKFEPGRRFRSLDAADELRAFRTRFAIPEPQLIYLDGNSLGRPTRDVANRLRLAAEDEWARDLIRGWNAGWFRAPSRLGESIARLVGAGPGQVVVTDSTSVNLFKLTLAALALRPERTVIVSDALNFPSDSMFCRLLELSDTTSPSHHRPTALPSKTTTCCRMSTTGRHLFAFRTWPSRADSSMTRPRSRAAPTRQALWHCGT